MKRRTQDHIIGDLARSNVELVLIEHGWNVNRITSDYGEDLIGSPTGANQVLESFHVFFQVKGIDKANLRREKPGKPAKSEKTPEGNAWSKPFEIRHLIRWKRMAEPVVLVMWDRATNDIRYNEALGSINLKKLVDLVKKGQKSLSIHFKKECTFGVDFLDKLASRYRLSVLENEVEIYLDMFAVAHDSLTFNTNVRLLSGRRNTSKLQSELLEAKQLLDGKLAELAEFIGVRLDDSDLQKNLQLDFESFRNVVIETPGDFDVEFHFFESLIYKFIEAITGEGSRERVVNALADYLKKEISVESKVAAL